MNVLKIEIQRNEKIDNSKQMAYYCDKDFFTALVTLCDELGVEVPVWTTNEERILEKKGQLDLDLENGAVMRIYSNME